MKRVYWRPNRIKKSILIYLGLLAVVGTLAIEHWPVRKVAKYHEQKLAAAELAARSMRTIRQARLAHGCPIDRRFDPADSGMIGMAMSPVTSLPSHLEAKQTSVNPNFAAAVLEMLLDAGVVPGDVVAVGYTGSFPAFNVCVCSAFETLGVTPIIIHSAASSQFGANCPEMMWLDMERAMYDAGLISFRSQAATLGGFGDRAHGMSDESRALLRASLDRNNVPLLEVALLSESMDKRIETYLSLAAGRPIKAYVNVGGGAASIHGSQGKEAIGAGLTRRIAAVEEDVDCVASRFLTAGVPVIHVGNATHLAKSYGLPVAPQEMPEVGRGAVFASSAPNQLIAALLLVAIAFFLRSYLWSGIWAHLAARLARLRARIRPSEMRLVATSAELMV